MNNVKDNSFLGSEPLGKLLFKLAIPTITAQIINLLYNIVDRIYIGHMEGIGDLALTGVGVCMPLIMIISAFAALVSSHQPQTWPFSPSSHRWSVHSGWVCAASEISDISISGCATLAVSTDSFTSLFCTSSK